jgi:O-antigen/teichoic acid export membrane protein
VQLLTSRGEEDAVSRMGRLKQWLYSRCLPTLSRARLNQAVFSIADQALSVGGLFLANVALARTQSKEEYGMFALSYSVFTFLAGLHNASILESYTVYGAGRYHLHFREYSSLIWRSNAVLGVLLTAVLLAIWAVLALTVPALASGSLLGLALTSAILLAGSLMRRTWYIRRRPDLAAGLSLVFFLTVVLGLAVAIWTRFLNGFSAFLIAAVGWILGGVFLAGELPEMNSGGSFLERYPNHWREHWNYSRWVFVTALVFQLTTQGYYWLVAGFLALKDVAALRAIYILVTPVDQLFVALSLIVLPMMAYRYSEKRLVDLFGLWKLYLSGCILVTMAFAVMIRLLGRPLLHILYGGKFDDVASLLSVLAFLPVIMGVGNTMNAALKSVEKPNVVFYAYVGSGAATLLAGVPLVRHFGLSGAVYGLLVSASAYTVIMGIGFLSFMQSRLHAEIPTAPDVKCL